MEESDGIARMDVVIRVRHSLQATVRQGRDELGRRMRVEDLRSCAADHKYGTSDRPDLVNAGPGAGRPRHLATIGLADVFPVHAEEQVVLESPPDVLAGPELVVTRDSFDELVGIVELGIPIYKIPDHLNAFVIQLRTGVDDREAAERLRSFQRHPQRNPPAH